MSRLAVLATAVWTIALAAAVAGPAAAQIPGQQTSPTPPTVDEPVDPLGRDSPRGTIVGFTSAVRREDFAVAESYMEVTARHRSDAHARARDLTALLDRYYKQSIMALSGSSAGVGTDGLPFDRERIELSIAGKPFDVTLMRVKDPQAGLVWLITADSLARAPALRRSLDERWIHQRMPQALVDRSIFGVSLALWTVWAASIGIPLLLLWLISAVVAALARRSVGDPARRRAFDAWYAGLNWPIILAVTLGIHLALSPVIGFSLTGRLLYTRVMLVVAVLVLAWLTWRLLTLFLVHARMVAQRRGYAGSRSLMLLGERVVKVLVILVTILVLLRLCGVDTTTALAGVGLGGVALALGAQKSVENLLGGISLLSDRALAVGDMCCVSNRLGWIEDITLRSVRLRTLEQTLLSMPAGALAQASIENFATRDKILVQTILRLQYGTTAAQLRAILGATRRLLAGHPHLEAESARIRLVDFGAYAVELELFAYVLTVDFLTFLDVREGLLLQIAEIVDASGSRFARPMQSSDPDDGDPGSTVPSTVLSASRPSVT